MKKSLVHVTFKEDDTGIFVRALDAAGIIFYGNLSQGIAIPISANHGYSQKDFDELFSRFQKCYEEETHATAEITQVWNKSQKFSSKVKATLEQTLRCQNIHLQNLMDLETAYELHLLKYRVTVNPADFNEVADYLAQLFRTDPAANTIDIILRNCNDFEEFDHGCEAINQRFKVSKWLREDFLPAFSSLYKISEWQVSDQQWPIKCRANTHYKISPKIDPQINSHLKCHSSTQAIVLSFSQAFATRDTFRSLAMPANPMPRIMEAHQLQRVSPEAFKEAPNAASGSRDPITAPSVTRYFLNGKELDPCCVTAFQDSPFCAVYISPKVRAHFSQHPYRAALEVFQGGEETHFTHDGHGKGACWLKRESRPTITNGLVISMKSHHPASEARIFFTEYFGEYEKRSERHSMRFFTPVAYGTHQKIKEVLLAPLLL